MKAAVAVALLFALPALSQNASPRNVSSTATIGTGSRVPGVTIRYVGKDGANSRFRIQNRTGHSVTAFAVLLIPRGVPRKNNHFVCQDRCTTAHDVGNNEHPSIRPGALRDLKYETAKINRGSVVVEAAIFDDGSYAGNERAAAYLVAEQLGDQAEYDRIVKAVNWALVGTVPPDTSKGSRIYNDLEKLPESADVPTMAAFHRWFPNLQDCGQRFSHVIKSASQKEVSTIAGTLQPLLADGGPSETVLAQWWNAMRHELESFGCPECMQRLATPTPPARSTMISIGCSARQAGPTGVNLTVEQVDDQESEDSPSDGANATADNSADDSADQDSSDNTLVMNSEPDDDPPSPGAADKTASDKSSREKTGEKTAGDTTAAVRESAKPMVVVVPPKHYTMPPPQLTPFGRIITTTSGSGTTEVRESRRLMAEDGVYQPYFYYVVQWAAFLSEGGTLEEAAKTGRSPDPFPAEMSQAERRLVADTAYDCVLALGDYMKKVPPGEAGVQFFGSALETAWKPLPEEDQRQRLLGDQRADDRADIIEAQLEKLRLKIGKNAARSLDGRVYQIYLATPGRLMREPLTENAMVSSYLRYVGWLDTNAAQSETEDGRDAARERTAEQRTSGLSDDDEALLLRTAGNFRRALLNGQTKAMAELKMSGVSSSGFRFSATPEGLRVGDEQVAHLKSAMSKVSFQMLTKRVHTLYDYVRISQVVPIDEGKTPAKTLSAQKSNAELSKPDAPPAPGHP